MSTLTKFRSFFLFSFIFELCFGQSIDGELRGSISNNQSTLRSDIQEIFINEDVYVNETTSAENYGEDSFFTVGRLNRQRCDSFLSIPDLSEETTVQNLQLCLYKVQGDINKYLSVRIIEDDWEEGNLTWNATRENSLITNEVIWYGPITVEDEEIQCLNIDNRFIHKIKTATGVSLYYDDEVDSSITFLSSEGCIGFGSSLSSCPHWKYSIAEAIASIPPVASLAVVISREHDENTVEESSIQRFLAPFLNNFLNDIFFQP